MRGANPPLARRSGLQISKDHQKCASAPHFRPKDFSLQASVRANSAERNEIPRAEKAREGRGQIRMRRERPHPLTHRASRLLWGRSRLSHAQRVTHLAASPSRSFGFVRQRPVHPVREKVRTRIKARNTTQDGDLPRFMMSRASKASWTGMLNSVSGVYLWEALPPSCGRRSRRDRSG